MKRSPAKPTIPPFEELNDRKLRALGKKLDKLADPNGYKHTNLLWKHMNDAGALLWHLARHGLVLEEVRSAGLFRNLGDYARHASAADIVAVLRRVPADMGELDRGQARAWVSFTPGVLPSIDPLITAAYLQDRAALLAAREELGDNVRLAIDFVRRRAGETIEPEASATILRHLVAQHCEHGLHTNSDLPWIKDGEAVAFALSSTAKVEELAALFGAPSAWAEEVLAWVLPRVKLFRERANQMAEQALAGLRLASLSDLVYLFGDGWWDARVVLQTLDARKDAPAALFAAALRLAAEGTGPCRIMVPQIAAEKPARGGGGGDDEDDDDDDGGGDAYDEYSEYDDGEADEDDGDEDVEEAGGDHERIRALALVLTIVGVERAVAAGEAIPPEVDARFDLDRVFESDPELVVRLRGALSALGPLRAHAVIRATLAKEFYAGKAAAVADVQFDAAVVEEVLARVGAGSYGVDADLLGFCTPAIVPQVVRAQARASSPEHAARWGEAILYILARASAAGQTWDAALDEHLQLDRIRFSYGGSKIDPVLAMLDRLPLERWTRVITANLERCAEEPWRLVRALRVDAPPDLVDRILAGVLARRQTITSGALGDRLRNFGEELAAPLVRALGDGPVENTLMKELERALAPAVFAAVKARLGQAIETPEQELRRLAASVPGPKVRIYRLARGEGEPAPGSVARIGGAPRGVSTPPVDRDEPMTHVITLDLAQLPELAARRPGVRGLSLYLPDPDTGDRHRHGALVWTREDELAGAPGSTAGARSVVVEAFDVPAAIFEGGELEGAAKRVRAIVYSSHGYAGGGPLWLQDGPAGEDPSFLFQFDEGLCHINLGDMGVMYVFEHEIDWQCH